jgi:hypothetical protein
MYRLVNKLIDQVRRETENEDVSSNAGIPDIEFLQYLNDAQDRLQSLITATHPTVFVKEKILDVTVDTEAYSIPDDAYKENAVTTVEYSPSNNIEDYYHLEQTTMKRRDTAVQGFPVTYIRRSGAVLLQPRPQQSGSIRLNYIKRIDRLDKRRGIVAVRVLDSSARTITTLELDPASSSPALDASTIGEDNYICICDRDGVPTMRNIPIDSIDAATGVITVSAGFTYEEGEYIDVGAYVTSGKDSRTHSELPRMCERYLIAYASWKLLKRDSSVDFAEQQAELKEMETDIVNSFADIDDDIRFVPTLNHWSDWSD